MKHLVHFFPNYTISESDKHHSMTGHASIQDRCQWHDKFDHCYNMQSFSSDKEVRISAFAELWSTGFSILSWKILVSSLPTPCNSMWCETCAMHAAFFEMGPIGSQNAKYMKLFSWIAWTNVDGFNLSIHQFKGHARSVKTRYCKLKSINIWTSYETKPVQK